MCSKNCGEHSIKRLIDRSYQSDLLTTAGEFGSWPRINHRIEPTRHRDALVRFFRSLPLALFAKTSRLFEITKVPCFTGFPSTGLVWGESRGLEPLAPI